MMVADAQIFMSLKHRYESKFSSEQHNNQYDMLHKGTLNDVLVNKVPHLSADQSTVYIKITISAWNVF